MARPNFPWKVRTETGAGAVRSRLINQIVNVPNWLRAALNLKGDEVPSNLLNPDVQPGIDVYQDGWSVAEYIDGTSFITVASPGAVIVPLATNRVARLLAMSAEHNAAAPRNIYVGLVAPGNNQIFVINQAIPVLVGFPTPVLIPQPIIVPPNYSLQIFNFNIVGAESMTPIAWTYVQVPIGFHAPSL